MLGNTLTLHLDPETSIVLSKINQDGYSSEYRLDDGEITYTAFIRHQTEKNKVNGLSMDRHQVLLRASYRPTEVFPQGKTIEAYYIVRRPQAVPASEALPIAVAIGGHAYGAALPILNWES